MDDLHCFESDILRSVVALGWPAFAVFVFVAAEYGGIVNTSADKGIGEGGR